MSANKLRPSSSLQFWILQLVGWTGWVVLLILRDITFVPAEYMLARVGIFSLDALVGMAGALRWQAGGRRHCRAGENSRKIGPGFARKSGVQCSECSNTRPQLEEPNTDSRSHIRQTTEAKGTREGSDQ